MYQKYYLQFLLLFFNFFPKCLGSDTRGREFFLNTEEFLPRVPRISTRGRGLFLIKNQVSSPSVALGEEVFFKKIEFLPRLFHSGMRVLKKTNFSPECCTRGRVFLKKSRWCQWRLIFPECKHDTRGRLPRVCDFWHSGKVASSWEASSEALTRVLHSGKASPSVLGPSPNTFGTQGSMWLL
jgi:hypothetical protein